MNRLPSTILVLLPFTAAALCFAGCDRSSSPARRSDSGQPAASVQSDSKSGDGEKVKSSKGGGGKGKKKKKHKNEAASEPATAAPSAKAPADAAK